MATKNIVPRASGEGGLGTSSKLWKEVHHVTASFGDTSLIEDASNNLNLTGGPLVASSGLSGSLTQLSDGSSFLVEGSNISITSASNGAITISSPLAGVLEDLDTLGAAASDGEFIVATGAGAFAYESGATARTSLGLGTGDSPTFTDLTLSGDLTVNGTTTTVNTTNLLVTDKLITLNDGGAASSGGGAGIEIEEDGSATGFIKVAADRAGWELQAPGNSNTLTIDATASKTLTVSGDLTVNADTTISSFGATLVDDADASAARTTLGVAIGSDVQAYDADLDTLSEMQTGAPGALALLTQAELEILDGATVTTSELNLLDTSAISAASGSSLRYDGTNLQWEAFSGGGGGSSAADDITLGDAEVNIKTTSGNINLSGSLIVATGSLIPAEAGSFDLGSTTKEWKDLYLSDDANIYFGNDQDVKITHNQDSGVTLLMNPSSDTPTFELKTTNDGQFVGPLLRFNHDSSSPAAGDTVGYVFFNGDSDTGVSRSYGSIRTSILSTTNSSERGKLQIGVLSNGSTSYDAITIEGTTSGGIATVDIPDHNGSTGGLKLGGTLVTSTAAEINYLDGANANIATLTLPASTTISSFGATLIDDADASAARTTLGIAVGSDVQAYDAGLADIAGLAVTDGNIIVGDGANWVAESGATARTSLGLGTGDSPTFTDLTLSGDLTVNGTTTTVNTDNLLVEDPIVLLGSGASAANSNGGLALLSGSSVSGESLVIGRVANDTWGVGRKDVTGGTVTTLADMTLVDFRAAAITATGHITPSAAASYDLGSSSGEWRNLYLGDSSFIYFGNDQDVRLQHSPDKGLILTLNNSGEGEPELNISSGVDQTSGPTLKLNMTKTPDVNDVMGNIEYLADNADGDNKIYGSITTSIVNKDSDVSFTGDMKFNVVSSGSLHTALLISGSDLRQTGSVDIPGHNATDSGLMLGGTLVTSTAAEINYLDGANANINTLTLPASTTISSFGATLVDDADASAARTTLGVAIGSDVQAYDADLDTLSGMQTGAPGALALLTQAELEILDGATVTTSELNLLDTSAISAASGSSLRYDGSSLQWEVFSGGGGGLSNIVEDTTPQLGGTLDLNSQTIQGNILPSAAGTYDLGSTSAEWRNIYLSDLSKIYFGADQDIYLDRYNNTSLQIKLPAAAAGGPTFQITGEDTGTQGPNFVIWHNTSSPAANDIVGNIKFQGESSSGSATNYAIIKSKITDETNGSQRGSLILSVEANSLETEAVKIEGGSSTGVSTVDIADHDGSAGGLKLGGTLVTATANELNILDGATVTSSELNLLDGGTSVGSSITLQNTDGFIVNDGGTMKLIPASDVSAFVGGGGSGGGKHGLTETKTASFTTTAFASAEERQLYIVDSASAVTATLANPGNTTYDGYELNIKRFGTGTVHITGSAGVLSIDGSSTFDLPSQYSSVTLVATGSQFVII